MQFENILDSSILYSWIGMIKWNSIVTRNVVERMPEIDSMAMGGGGNIGRTDSTTVFSSRR